MKKKYLEELTERLLTKYESEVVKEIVDIASLCLIDYDVSTKCTEIAIVETESVIMLKKFLATKMIEGKSKRTIKRYEYILTKMLNFLNVEIKDIDVYTLRGYLAYLEMNGSNDITVEVIRSKGFDVRSLSESVYGFITKQ